MHHRVLTAYFPRSHQADGALARLLADGVPSDAISLLPKFVGQLGDLGVKATTRATRGAAIGALVGGAVGATAGALAAAGSVIVPGLDAVLAGHFVAALAGAGAAGSLGLFIGALVGVALPAYEAAYLEDAVRLGGALVAVRCPTHQARWVEELLAACGGCRIQRGNAR